MIFIRLILKRNIKAELSYYSQTLIVYVMKSQQKIVIRTSSKIKEDKICCPYNVILYRAIFMAKYTTCIRYKDWVGAGKGISLRCIQSDPSGRAHCYYLVRLHYYFRPPYHSAATPSPNFNFQVSLRLPSSSPISF